MKKIKNFIFLLFFVFLGACGVISEGFKSPKQNKSDEFLVEKKSPLKLPPDYDQLPTPVENDSEENKNDSNIEEMINNNENKNNKSDTNSDLEESVLKKIKSN